MKKMYKLLVVFFGLLLLIPLANAALISEDADVRVVLSKYDPIPAEPDNNLRVWASIQNLGNERMDNAYIKLIPAYPFTLVPGELEIKDTGILNTNSDRIIDWRLFVDSNAKEGDYELEFIVCRDSECEKKIKTTRSSINVKTGGEPNVHIGVEETDALSFNKKAQVTINIVNKGQLDTKYLTITLQETSDFIVISPAEVYVGELESDDFETAVYDIYFIGDSRSPDTSLVNLPFLIEYSDENNKEYTEQSSIDLRVYSTDDLYKYDLKERSTPAIVYVLLLGVVIAGILIYRRARKKRKEKMSLQ